MPKENYIKRLERENRELREELNAHSETLTNLRIYLQSWKFTSSYAGDFDRRFLVNTQDVLDRLPAIYSV